MNGFQCKKSGYQWFTLSKVQFSMVCGVKRPVMNGLQCKKSGYQWFAV